MFSPPFSLRPTAPLHPEMNTSIEPSVRSTRALRHAKCYRELLRAGMQANASESELQPLVDKLVALIQRGDDIDLRVTKSDLKRPLTDEQYASCLTVAIGDLLAWDCADQFPGVARRVITAYVEAGYFHIDNFDAHMGTLEEHLTPLEKCIRFGCGTAAAVLIDLGADLSLVPALPKDQVELVDDGAVMKKDLDALLKEIAAQFPYAVPAIQAALMRRAMSSGPDPRRAADTNSHPNPSAARPKRPRL